MINIEEIIFNKSMTIEERVLYAFLKTERAYKQSAVDYGYIKAEETTENGLYYTIHSNQELMDLLGCGKSKLIRIKKNLEKKGLLKQKRMLDGYNKYFTFNEVI